MVAIRHICGVYGHAHHVCYRSNGAAVPPPFANARARKLNPPSVCGLQLRRSPSASDRPNHSARSDVRRPLDGRFLRIACEVAGLPRLSHSGVCRILCSALPPWPDCRRDDPT